MSLSPRLSRVLAVFFALIALSIAAVSCARKGPARALVPEGYAAWRRTTDRALDYPIPGHESSARTIFMNPEGFLFQRNASGVEFPQGAVLVKEIRPLGKVTADMPAPMLTVMVKASADERARGGWLWIVKDTATQTETVFESDFCYRCHANANEPQPYADKNPKGEYRDYVFFVPGLDTPAPLPPQAPVTGQGATASGQASGDGY